MSDNTLSQEEIEALLSGTPIETDNSEINTEDFLSELEQDTLGEIGNISFGSSATALSTLLGQTVDITTPAVSLIEKAKLNEEFILPYAAIQVEYTEGLSGVNLLVIKQSDAAIIADLMLGGDGTSPNNDLGEIHLSAVQEAMNQMMGSAATSMSTVFNKKVDISPPSIALMDIQEDEGTEQLPEADLLIKISFALQIGDLIDSEIMQLFPLEFGKKIVSILLSDESDVEEEVAAAVVDITPQMEEEPQRIQQPIYESKPNPVMQEKPKRAQKPQVQVQQAQFASFENSTLSQTESQNLDLLLDIPLQVTVELGRTKRSVKEILEMSSGSIIELDKLAGEPVDILVNNRLIANGEVVVIDENFGVRITDILSQTERLNNLR